MSGETKFLGGILILTVALLGGAVFFLSRQQSAVPVQSDQVYQIDYSKGQKIGSDSAKVKLVEFSDFQCPACLSAEPYVRKLRNDYPNGVQFYYRHFPLMQHPYSRQAAYISEAAAEEGKFWEMHDKLFETQSQWSALGENEVKAFFIDLGKQLNLNEEKVKQALENEVYKAKVEADSAEALSLRVNSTPTFYLNGYKLNLKSFEDLNTAVAKELKKSN